ncbi:MAG: hypothetical protein U5R06_02170 [candidate division KSB1 bacterium]|nr:hypothetical protein [candidate division KSB1 bacterium]
MASSEKIDIWIASEDDLFCSFLEIIIGLFDIKDLDVHKLNKNSNDRDTLIKVFHEKNQLKPTQIIIQHIPYINFKDSNRNKKETLKQLTTDINNPLFYRYSFKRYRKEIGKNKKKNIHIAYKNSCHPILYLTNQRITEAEQERKGALFLDCSIWNRCIWLQDPLFLVRFYNRLCDYKTWIDEKLYERTVALEVLDYHIRMLEAQRIEDIDPGNRGGHGESLGKKLGGWHSETKYNDKFIKEFGSKIYHQRRFLVVDDFGQNELRRIDKGGNGNFNKQNGVNKKKVVKFSKGYYVDAALNKIYKEKRAEFEIAFAANLSTANKDLKRQNEDFYDIILLDYLLHKDANEDELGSQLIWKLIVGTQSYHKLDNRFWIFPISSWSFAMLAEMESGKTDIVNSVYFLDSGADPVTMPCLFRYKLAKFLDQQVEDVNKYYKRFESIIPDDFAEIDESNKLKDISKSCLREVVRLQAKIDGLKQNEKDGSLFAKSFLKNSPSKYQAQHLDHLQHLLYLVSYGSGLEWSEMWEECRYIKNRVYEMGFDIKKISLLIKNIEKYINQLHHNYDI